MYKRDLTLHVVGKVTSNIEVESGNNFNVLWTDTTRLKKGTILVAISREDVEGKNCLTCKHEQDKEMDRFPCVNCGENGDLTGWYKNWEEKND